MKPEEQRIAIAEACGWKLKQETDGEWALINPDGEKDSADWEPNTTLESFSYRLPDYLNDLNAMAEAEKVLNPQQAYEYGDALAQMIRDEEDKALNERVGRKWKFNGHGYFKIATLTATQRAPVFLKTIGKWTP